MIDPLVERAQHGDVSALEELLGQVAPSVRRFGMRMCRNPDDADDALQDTLLTITTHLGEFAGRSSFTSWVFALTRSACVRRRRGLKNQPAEGDHELANHADLGPGPEEQVSDSELSRALAAAMDHLSDEHREVLQLRDVEGLTAPEAAESLGITVDALKSRLHRARSAIRDALKPVLEPGAVPVREGCPDVILMWSRKLEGDLNSEVCAEIEAHVSKCPSCGVACSALRRALGACRRSGQEPVEQAVQEKIRGAVKAILARRVAT